MGVEFSRTVALSLLDQDLQGYTDELSLVRADLLRKSLFKKFASTNADVKVLQNQAFDLFLADNADLLQIDPSNCPILHQIKGEIAYLFSDVFSLSDCCNMGYCGTGSSVGSPETDFLTKMFSSRLSATSSLLHLYYRQTIRGTSWELADKIRDLTFGTDSNCPGSRLDSVPKDEKRRRVICIEPTLNMFFQLGAKLMLDRALQSRYNLDMSTQQILNRNLAREGSRNGRFATLDLKNASDRISLQLAEAVLPRWLFNILCQLRSNSTSVRGNRVVLNGLSTMGNGTTFPIMTAIVSAVVRSVYQKNNVHPRNGVNYAVFGDDIVCLTDLSQEITETLTQLGFIINLDKSFLSGPFRESCGGDYHKGYNVRPVFIKELKNESDFYSVFNRLLRWSCRYGMPIPNLLSYVLRGRRLRAIPAYEPETAGIYMPYDYQRLDKDENGSTIYYRKVAVARTFRIKSTHPNYEGCKITFIGGYITGGTISRRQNVPRYKVLPTVTPHWDLECEFTEGWFNHQDHRAVMSRVLTLLIKHEIVGS